MQVRQMEKRPRNKSQLNRARHFLHCVILEQRAATEELKASNSELERLLEEVLVSRSDLRGIGGEEVEEAPGAAAKSDADDRSVTELKREADAIMEQASAAIRASMLLRRRCQKIREALRIAGGVKPAPERQGLSRREHQVLTLIVEGKSSKEIAAALGISFKTAVTHRASIMSKLDVHEIASVVREAIRRGLV
jgi:DNA-binding CsgD family transcriptional regulator